MSPGRRTWYVASALLLLGATAAFGAVHQHWLPCRGSMLSGSVVNGYAYGTDFTDGCLEAMDDGFAFISPAGGDRFSVETAQGALAAVLLGLAWFVVVVSSSWSSDTRRTALLPTYATWALAALGLIGGGVAEPVVVLLLLAPGVLALVAFGAILARESPSPLAVAQVALALSATTILGLLPAIGDYWVMGTLSEADWDAPPGSGYPTVAVLLILTLVLVVVTALRPVGRRAEADAENRGRVVTLDDAV